MFTFLKSENLNIWPLLENPKLKSVQLIIKATSDVWIKVITILLHSFCAELELESVFVTKQIWTYDLVIWCKREMMGKNPSTNKKLYAQTYRSI